MIVTVTGVKNYDFTNKQTGEAVKGCKLFYLVPSRDRSFNGYESRERYVNGLNNPDLYDKAKAIVPLSQYDILFDSDGERTYLIDIVPC